MEEKNEEKIMTPYDCVAMPIDYEGQYGNHQLLIAPKGKAKEVSFAKVPYKSRIDGLLAEDKLAISKYPIPELEIDDDQPEDFIPLDVDYQNPHGNHQIFITKKGYRETVSFKEVPYKSRIYDEETKPSVEKTKFKKKIMQLFARKKQHKIDAEEEERSL